MVICLPQQCAVVCAAHGEAGGGAAVAEGERRIARTEGCNIGEGEGGSAAFGGEDNGLDALRAEAGQIGKDALQGCRLMGDIDVENIADLAQPDQLGVLEDVGLSRVEDTQAGGEGAVADAAVVGDIAVLYRTAARAAAVLAAAAFDRRPAAPLVAEGGQLLRLSDDTVFDRAAVPSLARLGAGGLFGDDPIAEGVGLADGVGGRGADKDIDKRGGFWYSTRVPCANDTRWCGAMAAQLICNQSVAGSTPVTSSKKSYDIPLKSGVCRGAFAFWEKVRRTVQ